MSLFEDILDTKTPEEKFKDMREELDDSIREVRELQDELANKDKRTARAHELLKQTKRYIKCLQDKLSDEELEQAKSDFDRLEREGAWVNAHQRHGRSRGSVWMRWLGQYSSVRSQPICFDSPSRSGNNEARWTPYLLRIPFNSLRNEFGMTQRLISLGLQRLPGIWVNCKESCLRSNSWCNMVGNELTDCL